MPSLSIVPGNSFPPASRDGGDADVWTRGAARVLPPQGPTLSEIFAGNGRDAGGVGFALSQVRPGAPLLWIQDRMSILESGRPFAAALPDFIHVEARDAKSALWAMEEGLRCPALGAVIGEIWGNPAALDFTATRRLAVAAERQGVPAILILFGCEPNLSGARMRCRVESRPSSPHAHDPRAPGTPVWSLDLFRARGVQPGRWEIGHDAGSPREVVGEAAGETNRLDPLSVTGHGQLDAAPDLRLTG